jgi:hypothetical protein
MRLAGGIEMGQAFVGGRTWVVIFLRSHGGGRASAAGRVERLQ